MSLSLISLKSVGVIFTNIIECNRGIDPFRIDKTLYAKISIGKSI